jgi:NAD(P)-dependent dehydrogenase (short-subunit alcohol dehydrogenase family)
MRGNAVAVITGASRGIGKATALALSQANYRVVCAARTGGGRPSKLPGTLEETVDAIEQAGGSALAVPCDVSQDRDVEALAAQTLAEFGRIDVLVNNAAVNYRAAIAETASRYWDVTMSVNLGGTFRCCRAFFTAMKQEGGGRMINISSGAADDAAVSAELGITAYAVSKAAVEALSRGLAEELRPDGIAVNCLRIEAAVATEGARAVDPDGDYSAWEAPEDVAEAILWVARRDISYTGNVLTLADTRSSGG